MADAQPPLRDLEGPYGTALELPVDSRQEFSATVQHWLVTSPAWHPAWSQYLLAVLRLGDVEGFPPARKNFPAATHELMVIALNPEHGHQDRETMARYADSQSPLYEKLPYLTPGNISEQVTATDEEMRRVPEPLIRGILAGMLSPETFDAPQAIRAHWHRQVALCLEHARGLHWQAP